MRVKITAKGTIYRKADGTYTTPLESPEELAELSRQAELNRDDRQVSAALNCSRQHRDLEPQTLAF
jgi:hypothetical protein